MRRSVLALLLLLVGRGGQTFEAGDVSVFVAPWESGHDDAQHSGEITLVGSCLGVEGVTVIWPHGTEVVSEESLTIDIPNLGERGIGDHVELAGGYAFEPTPGVAIDGPVEVMDFSVPADCAVAGVFNSWVD